MSQWWLGWVSNGLFWNGHGSVIQSALVAFAPCEVHSQLVLRLCYPSLVVLVRHGHLEACEGVLVMFQALFIVMLAEHIAQLHSDVSNRVQELSRAADS